MLSQLTEQVKKSSQPASDLFAANLKVLQAISKQQAELTSGILGDSMKLMQSVGEQTEVNGMLAAQTVYAESVRDRLTASSKTTFGTLSAAGQQFADTMKASFDLSTSSASTAPAPVKATAKAPVKKAATKKVVSKKVAPKKVAPKKVSAKSADTVVAANKAPEKTAPEKKAAPVKRAVSRKTSTAPKAAAPVETKKSTTSVKASTKKVAKPVPTLNADNVRATPKQAAVETPSKPSGTSEA